MAFIAIQKLIFFAIKMKLKSLAKDVTLMIQEAILLQQPIHSDHYCPELP